MGISILMPIYQEAKYLEKFLSRLSKQTHKNYEVVFIVDTSNDNCLKVIDEYDGLIKGDIKVVYNSKRQGRYLALKKAINIASKEYVIISSPTDVFKDNLIQDINDTTKRVKTDIIEFHARCHSPIWFNGLIRKNIKVNKGKMTHAKKSDIFAYTYPFEFNKIIKSKIIKKVIEYPKINNSTNNSRFAVEILFRCVLLAESYYVWNEKVVRSKKINGNNYNPISILREWDKLISDENFRDFITPLKYNKYFSSKIIYQPYIKSFKTASLQEKFNKKLKYFDDENFFTINTYILKNNKESNLLKDYKNKNSFKAYKEL